MRTVQPPMETTTLVLPQCFDVPDLFRMRLLTTFQHIMKPKRSLGPEGIRTEVFSTALALFSNATLSLCRAVCQIGRDPSLLCFRILCPIYKDKGNLTTTSNNRQIALLPFFCLLISTAIRHDFRQQYTSEPNQLGSKQVQTRNAQLSSRLIRFVTNSPTLCSSISRRHTTFSNGASYRG